MLESLLDSTRNAFDNAEHTMPLLCVPIVVALCVFQSQ